MASRRALLGKLAGNDAGDEEGKQGDPVAAVADGEGQYGRQEEEVECGGGEDGEVDGVAESPVCRHQKDADHEGHGDGGLVNMQPTEVDSYNDSGGRR